MLPERRVLLVFLDHDEVTTGNIDLFGFRTPARAGSPLETLSGRRLRLRLDRLHSVLRLPTNLSVAWDFFSDPRNLKRLTPPSLGIEITSEAPSRMVPGMIVTYSIRPLLGIPVRWVTEITHVREPNLFVDEQRFGPYRFWHHQHHFREVDGGIEVEDLVHYGLPFGGIGRFLGGRHVRRQLAGIFSFRKTFLEGMFGTMPETGSR